MATSISETEYTYYKLNPMNWIFPDFISSVFGTGKSYFGSEGLKNFGSSSDSGYLNMIYRGGVILSVLLYSLISYLCVDKRFKKIDLTYQIGLMCLLALAIQHYKGGVFYFNEYTTLIVMVMHISYVMYTKQERMDKIAEN